MRPFQLGQGRVSVRMERSRKKLKEETCVYRHIGHLWLRRWRVCPVEGRKGDEQAGDLCSLFIEVSFNKMWNATAPDEQAAPCHSHLFITINQSATTKNHLLDIVLVPLHTSETLLTCQNTYTSTRMAGSTICGRLLDYSDTISVIHFISRWFECGGRSL